MIHNLIKYLVQARLRLWDIKITNFKPDKVVYHHNIYMCDFFGEFRHLFYCDLHRFSRNLWFALDTFPKKKKAKPGRTWSREPTCDHDVVVFHHHLIRLELNQNKDKRIIRYERNNICIIKKDTVGSIR